jgi:hypothetical protein
VLELLARPLDVPRLQQLTVQMWQTKADSRLRSDATWIAASDHSIRVLHRKVDWLELQLTRPTSMRVGAQRNEAWAREQAWLYEQQQKEAGHG